MSFCKNIFPVKVMLNSREKLKRDWENWFVLEILYLFCFYSCKVFIPIFQFSAVYENKKVLFSAYYFTTPNKIKHNDNLDGFIRNLHSATSWLQAYSQYKLATRRCTWFNLVVGQLLLVIYSLACRREYIIKFLSYPFRTYLLHTFKTIFPFVVVSF